jgi:hypothetical protein
MSSMVWGGGGGGFPITTTNVREALGQSSSARVRFEATKSVTTISQSKLFIQPYLARHTPSTDVELCPPSASSLYVMQRNRFGTPQTQLIGATGASFDAYDSWESNS